MINEAIILCGGLGTRLQSVVSDRPKCLALVGDIPFLHYLILYLQQQGVHHFIFSTGYLHEMIETYLAENHAELKYSIAVESKPLGTGGAINLAARYAREADVLVCNGDTLYLADLPSLADFHKMHNAVCTLSLKPMQHFDRYGAVVLNEDHSIRSFAEKKYYDSGLINGGTYALNLPVFTAQAPAEVFSFERDFLERKVTDGKDQHELYGMIQDAYFIDIGIPADFEKANKELPGIF